MIDQQIRPGVLAKTILSRSVAKVTPERAIQAMKGYFNLYRQHFSERIPINIAEEICLITAIAEAYTRDEIYTLFNAGIVLFPEIMFINKTKLHKVLCVSRVRLTRSLMRGPIKEFKELPVSFVNRLFELGFIDSKRWKGYSFQDSMEFYHLVVPRVMIFNPLPEDLGDILSNFEQSRINSDEKSMEASSSEFEPSIIPLKEKTIVDELIEKPSESTDAADGDKSDENSEEDKDELGEDIFNDFQ